MKTVVYILFSASLLITAGCNPIYVTNAGYHQARLLLARESSNELLKSEVLDDKTKKKIKLAIEVREFAKTLGLEVGEKYNSVSLYNFPNLWVITAAPQFSLEPFTWWFPIVGEVPYKGHFEKKNAVSEAEILAEKKLDVSIRTASAFSTLGWFEDPITTGLLELDELEFVNTIFHELFHSTIWFKNEVEVNETLANAFGYVASLEFYKLKDQSKVNSISDSLLRRCQFSMRLDQIKRRLEIIYSAELTESAKILRKQQEFDKFTEIFKKNDDFGEDGDLKKFSDFNNAFFLGLYSYYQGFDRYVNYFNSGETLSSVLEELKSAQDSSEYDNLANFIEARSALKSKQDLCAGDNHTSNLSK